MVEGKWGLRVVRSPNMKNAIASPNYREQLMTKTEILAAIKQMTTEQRLEIMEAISRMMREEIEEKNRIKQEIDKQIRAAAEAAIPDYMPGGALHDLWSADSEPYYDSEEEFLNALKGEEKTNA